MSLPTTPVLPQDLLESHTQAAEGGRDAKLQRRPEGRMNHDALNGIGEPWPAVDDQIKTAKGKVWLGGFLVLRKDSEPTV
jgi:hypothetical protein